MSIFERTNENIKHQLKQWLVAILNEYYCFQIDPNTFKYKAKGTNNNSSVPANGLNSSSTMSRTSNTNTHSLIATSA